MDRSESKLGVVEFAEETLTGSVISSPPGENDPPYGSSMFWRQLDVATVCSTLELEKLVGYVRQAVEIGDAAGRNRLVELIIWRTQAMNETWAYFALSKSPITIHDLEGQAWDLYADLCERLVRAFIAPQRRFWEVNFLHCLRFERQHAYRAFMLREGYWQQAQAWRSKRIPRVLLCSLDQPRESETRADALEEWYLEDERAYHELLQVEQPGLLNLILAYPAKLRSVLLLIFWEGRTEKEVARILGVTDRTIRNRLREAFKLLRAEIQLEEGHDG